MRKPASHLAGRAAAVAAVTAVFALAACAPTQAGSAAIEPGNAVSPPSPAISHPASAAAAAAEFTFTASCAGAAAAYDVTSAGTAAWAVHLPGASVAGDGPQPVTADGLGVFAFGNVISARRLTDGGQAWQRAYPEPADSDAGDVGGLWLWHGELIALIAPAYLGQAPAAMRVQALDPATGAVRWTAGLGTGDLYNDQVITSGGVLAVLTETGGAGGLGKLMAFDLNTRRLLWSRPYGKDELTDGPTAAGPAIVMASRGTVTGFDARTGAVRWAHGGLPAVESVAGPGNSVLLYYPMPQAMASQPPASSWELFPVTALDASTGAVLWRAKPAGPVDHLSAGGGLITVGTAGAGRLTVLTASGHVAWSVPAFAANDMTWVDTGTDLIYVSSEPQMRAPGIQPGLTRLVDRRLSDGAVRWSTRLGDYVAARVVRPAGGNLIVTEAPGPAGAPAAALSVDPSTGRVRAAAPLAAAPGPPSVAGGDTLVMITSAPCPGPVSPAVTASGQPQP